MYLYTKNKVCRSSIQKLEPEDNTQTLYCSWAWPW